jgi:adenosyl cobinamide kinase/adenosyl cobinamide phosphate guanylyltransferase
MRAYSIGGIDMILIFGGAYQGKLAYAKDRFKLTEGDIYMCGENTDMPENKKLVYEIDKWILALVKAGIDTDETTGRFIERNFNAIVVCNDISCGVVPVDAVLRIWREAVGRALTEISRCSSEVLRLFCGIPTRIK